MPVCCHCHLMANVTRDAQRLRGALWTRTLKHEAKGRATAMGLVTFAVSRGLPQVHSAWRCAYSTSKLAVWATFFYFQRILCVTPSGGFLRKIKLKNAALQALIIENCNSGQKFSLLTGKMNTGRTRSVTRHVPEVLVTNRDALLQICTGKPAPGSHLAQLHAPGILHH